MNLARVQFGGRVLESLNDAQKKNGYPGAKQYLHGTKRSDALLEVKDYIVPVSELVLAIVMQDDANRSALKLRPQIISGVEPVSRGEVVER